MAASARARKSCSVQTPPQQLHWKLLELASGAAAGPEAGESLAHLLPSCAADTASEEPGTRASAPLPAVTEACMNIGAAAPGLRARAGTSVPEHRGQQYFITNKFT
mmetsp:Transcript_23191/g.63654  ORF Transcript_23191/g.63654 Transcript_23191/m.63654 type:complete len:106 (+) Transcript_23191:1314-1631(+)